MEPYPLPYSQQHGFAPAQAARDLCIPILKFSYAVSSNERSSPLGWIHLASTGNLMLSFHEATDLADGSRVLRVTKGAEILVSARRCSFRCVLMLAKSYGCCFSDM